MFKKILVAIDGSNNSYDALKKALELVKALDAKLYLVSVVSTANLPINVGVSYAPNLERDLTKDARKDLELAQSMVKDSGQEYETFLLSGDPRDELIDISKEEHMDLVILGKSGVHALERVLTGSVTRYVSEHAGTSVLIVE